MKFEVRPAESASACKDFKEIIWGEPGSTGMGVNATINPWLTQLGTVNDEVIDLVRLAAAAYLADRLMVRDTGFSRTIHIHIQLSRATIWSPLLPIVEHLLSWLSGDEWIISVSQESCTRSTPVQSNLGIPANRLSLFSGGLDSFCGAMIKPGGLYFSHTESSTTTAAQRNAWGWLQDYGSGGERIAIAFTESGIKREATTRTRAFLFYALAIAVAKANGITLVELPENGFTSINLPFGNDRGGVLSTRSTHPWTLHLVRKLLDAAGIEVQLSNPYEWLTKGELVGVAATISPMIEKGLHNTLSCAKLDGGRYKGGNPNLNCGLCVACLIRRAGILAAGIEDQTIYLANSLDGESLAHLRARRAIDVQAVISHVGHDLDEFDIIEAGPFPEDFDIAAAADLCRRGRMELAALMATL